MKKEKEFIEWIKKQVEFYQPFLGLHLHSITVEKSKEVRPDFRLEITCTYPYFDPTIRYTEEAFKDWADNKLPPNRILHELIHILTDPLYCKAITRFTTRNEIEDERERLTDTLTLIIRNLLK